MWQWISRGMPARRPSPALVISIVALFIALGGTGYAALKLPKNSVGSAQVINGSLQTADLAAKAKSALHGPGPQGAQGSQGTQGATGPAGSAGPAGSDATINGVAAGGDLSGTYPNPTIKDGAITSAKFGAGALAPNANLLDGIDSSGFVQGGGTRYSFNLTCHGCNFPVVQGGAGRVELDCFANGTRIAFSALNPPVTYDLWTDFDGSLSRTTVAANTFVSTPFQMSGIHRVVLRSQETGGTGRIGGYDIFLDATNCHAMGFVEIQSPP